MKEAFDEALAEAKSGGSIPQQADESLEFQEQPVTDGLSEALWRVAPVEMAESQETTIPEPQIATFTETFQGFLAQMTYFDDLSGWQELLQTVNQLPIEAYGDAREELAAFFDYHYQILSKQVQDLLIT